MAKPKTKSKMTWAKLANDPSISKTELPRIARAFGLKKPEDVPAGARRSRVAGGYKPKAKPKAKPSVQKEPAAISKTRQKAVAPKAKAKAAPKAAPKAKTTRRRTQYETGTESGFEEGTYRKRVKTRGTGMAGRGKGRTTTLHKVKQPGAARLQKGGRGGLTEAGKMVKMLRESREKRRK